MRLIVEIDLNPCEEGHTMTERKLKAVRPRVEALVAQDRDLLKALVKEALDQILQAEMTDFLGAGPGANCHARRLPGGLLRAWTGDAGRQDRAAGWRRRRACTAVMRPGARASGCTAG